MANLVLSFAELLTGAILLDAAIKGDSIGNVITGKATSHPLLDSSSSSSATSGAASSVGTVAPGTYVNPVPGASTGRIDQGVDYTGSSFVAPGASKILAADASNPGWKGGGWIAAQLTDGPLAGAVYYIAEGVKPLVKVGDTVAAGTPLASAATNPYNGIVGNIEAGWANATGTAPLAQSLSGYGGDQSTQALTAGYSFSKFVHSLGGVSGVFQGAGSSLAGAIEHAFLAGAEAGVVPFS
jgi:biotin carboxyl carrier protein